MDDSKEHSKFDVWCLAAKAGSHPMLQMWLVESYHFLEIPICYPNDQPYINLGIRVLWHIMTNDYNGVPSTFRKPPCFVEQKQGCASHPRSRISTDLNAEPSRHYLCPRRQAVLCVTRSHRSMGLGQNCSNKTHVWLVVGPPLWRILDYESQLGWWHSQYFWENAKSMATIHHQSSFTNYIPTISPYFDG